MRDRNSQLAAEQMEVFGGRHSGLSVFDLAKHVNHEHCRLSLAVHAALAALNARRPEEAHRILSEAANSKVN